MEENILLAELTKNCDGKKEKLLELLKAFDLANLGYDIQEQMCKDVHNRVLAEHEFFCDKEFSRDTGIKAGDRITDEEYLFLLSDEDFDRVMELSLPIMVAEKITDDGGYFLEDWGKIRCDARCTLVDFLIGEIVPASFRELFGKSRSNIVFQEKLINAFKNCVKKAA